MTNLWNVSACQSMMAGRCVSGWVSERVGVSGRFDKGNLSSSRVRAGSWVWAGAIIRTDNTHSGADIPLLTGSCLKFESNICALLGIMICLC